MCLTAHSPYVSNEDKTDMLQPSLPRRKPSQKLIGNYSINQPKKVLSKSHF